MTEYNLIRGFLDQVEMRPEQTAVLTPEHEWTYQALKWESIRVASFLEKAGTVPGDRCALLFSHGAEMVSGVLGALMAGLTYVPLDAAYPITRLEQMLTLSQAKIVLTDEANRDLAGQLAGSLSVLSLADAPATSEDTDRWRQRRGEDEAYVLFTSGSTGIPKPVVQTHRNVEHHATVWGRGLGIGPSDRVSLQSAYSWDSSVQDLYGALLFGAVLCPINLRSLGIGGLIDWFKHVDMSVYHSTVPVFRAVSRALSERQTELPSMRILALGGDAILASDLDYYRILFPDTCRLASAYGSTECSCALLKVVDKSFELTTPALPLGDPVEKTQVDLIDDKGRVVDGPGEGELVVRSAFLSLRHGRELNDEIGTLRTGDLVARSPDGTMTSLGRQDFVVKISGIRVDLGETEGVLAQSGLVSSVAVASFTDDLGELQLAAYVVPREGAVDVAILRDYVRSRLPPQAQPARYVLLENLPLTDNLKIDRRALPAPSSVALTRHGLGHRSSLAGELMEYMAGVLGGREIGMEENFFDAGLNSIRLAEFHEVVNRKGHKVRLADIYRAGSLKGLAAHLGGEKAQSSTSEGMARGARRRALTKARRPKSKKNVEQYGTRE